MLTVKNAAKGIPWDLAQKRESPSPQAASTPPRATGPPVDTVVLKTQVKVPREEEYLVATYWG